MKRIMSFFNKSTAARELQELTNKHLQQIVTILRMKYRQHIEPGKYLNITDVQFLLNKSFSNCEQHIRAYNILLSVSMLLNSNISQGELDVARQNVIHNLDKIDSTLWCFHANTSNDYSLLVEFKSYLQKAYPLIETSLPRIISALTESSRKRVYLTCLETANLRLAMHEITALTEYYEETILNRVYIDNYSKNHFHEILTSGLSYCSSLLIKQMSNPFVLSNEVGSQVYSGHDIMKFLKLTIQVCNICDYADVEIQKLEKIKSKIRDLCLVVEGVVRREEFQIEFNTLYQFIQNSVLPILNELSISCIHPWDVATLPLELITKRLIDILMNDVAASTMQIVHKLKGSSDLTVDMLEHHLDLVKRSYRQLKAKNSLMQKFRVNSITLEKFYKILFSSMEFLDQLNICKQGSAEVAQSGAKMTIEKTIKSLDVSIELLDRYIMEKQSDYEAAKDGIESDDLVATSRRL